MNAEQILEEVITSGGQIILLDGKLRAKGLDHVTRPLVKKHKAGLIRLLQKPDPLKIISPDEWINNHLDVLEIAGFTDRDLYNKSWPVGVVFLQLWENPGLLVELEGNTLYFTWMNNTGRRVTQSCRPEKEAPPY